MIVVTSIHTKDETKIKVGEEFQSLPMIHQLDVLRNTISLLVNFYDDKLRCFDENETQGKTKH